MDSWLIVSVIEINVIIFIIVRIWFGELRFRKVFYILLVFFFIIVEFINILKFLLLLKECIFCEVLKRWCD